MAPIRTAVLAAALVALLPPQAPAADLAVSSFSGNGLLAWTNTMATNAVFRIEWAAQPEGPWHRTFDRLGSIDASSATSLQAAVPMFYRVVGTTNAPPAGMIWVDPGDTVQGQPEVSHAKPVHTNYVSGFWMDEMEVSKELWTETHAWALTNGYGFDNPGVAKTNGHPIHTVNWHDAVKWCNARSQREGLTPCYYTSSARTTIYQTGTTNIGNPSVLWDANGYRLPTEAEWEKAARGGYTRCHYPWGSDTIQHAQANYYSSDTYAAYDLSPTRGSRTVRRP